MFDGSGVEPGTAEKAGNTKVGDIVAARVDGSGVEVELDVSDEGPRLRGRPADADRGYRLVVRDLEGQRLVTEPLPVVRHIVEDDVLVLEDVVGDDIVLLQIEDRLVVQHAVDLDLLAVDLFLGLLDVGRVLAPAGVLPEALQLIGFTIFSHFHGVNPPASDFRISAGTNLQALGATRVLHTRSAINPRGGTPLLDYRARARLPGRARDLE